ncbi:MASE1 domain-containing protein [Actinoallomurus purpureus]|uniref:MASE1 domain-containing protein n=1 Tax=Actinoallomurus purpureus TaxID=478114 RepID=UPI00209356F5|nr:MASE1 domain-containing protein [Actinoallomurus purpureus]MCO6005664.1 MASE1 domain-containing protein [Actinoallomurus purpureus]
MSAAVGIRLVRLRQAACAGPRILLTAALYYGTARLGLLLALVNEQVTPLWLPTGVAVCCLLMLGLRTWPGVAVAAFAVNAAIGPTLPAVLGITAGNTLAPLCSCLLLRRAGFRCELDRLRDALSLIFLGAFAGMLVSATAGASALVLSGAVPAEGLPSTLAVWWTGDTMGVLVMVPLVMAVRSTGLPRFGAVRWAEVAVLLGGTLCAAVFVTRAPYQLLFLVFPILIWAAFRFGHLGAAFCVLIVSVSATLAAVHRAGPFADKGLLHAMLNLQLFNGTVALTSLLLAAVILQRDAACRDLEHVAQNLTAMAAELEHGHLTLKAMALDMLRARHGAAPPVSRTGPEPAPAAGRGPDDPPVRRRA